MGQKNSKQSTAIRAKIAGIILSFLMLLSTFYLIFIQKIPLSTFPKFQLIVMGAIFFIGIGLFFKNKACWYLAVIFSIFIIIAGISSFSEFNRYAVKYTGKSYGFIFSLLISLPWTVPLLMLLSDRPEKWREINIVENGYPNQETSIDKQISNPSVTTSGSESQKIIEYPNEVATKQCPKCAEEIKLEALICRFCGYEFDENDVQKTIQELEDRKEEERRNLEAKIERKEESLRVQKSLKMKKVDRIKMNTQYALGALMGTIFLFIAGLMSIVLIVEASKGDFGGMLVFGFLLFFFILAFILTYRKTKKIKSDLANAIKEIEELAAALPK